MKHITICGTQYELTQERTRRIVDAMIETQRKLDKQLSYPEDLRNDEHNALIASYQAHIVKLESMLS